MHCNLFAEEALADLLGREVWFSRDFLCWGDTRKRLSCKPSAANIPRINGERGKISALVLK